MEEKENTLQSQNLKWNQKLEGNENNREEEIEIKKTKKK